MEVIQITMKTFSIPISLCLNGLRNGETLVVLFSESRLAWEAHTLRNILDAELPQRLTGCTVKSCNQRQLVCLL